MVRCWYGGYRKKLHREPFGMSARSDKEIARRSESGQNFARGSPAHAGTDPRNASPAARRARLPRPRGDGPGPDRSKGERAWAPPPTRGWTPCCWACGRTLAGSPAHAGMDPRLHHGRIRDGWLPRPRGDGPVSPPALTSPDRAPPPTRGWTRGRGGAADIPGAPPPTRGWTAHGLVAAAGVDGSPAHAGMDPRANADSQVGLGLPRPRGDGPTSERSARGAREAPPPTRGWTAVRKTRRSRRSGMPARSSALHPGNWPPIREDPPGSGHGRCGTAASGEFAVLDLANDLPYQAAPLERVAKIDGAVAPQGG